MGAFSDTLKALFDPIVISIALTYAYSFLIGKDVSLRLRQVSMGTLLGVAGVIALMMPLQFSEGVIFDLRNLMVGMAAAFFGIVGGVIALTMTAITRIFIGGAGLTSALLAMVLAGGAGLLWARYLQDGKIPSTLSFGVLGLMISAHSLAALTLPAEVIGYFMSAIMPKLAILNVLGCVLIGTLLRREDQLGVEKVHLVEAAQTDPLTQLLNRRSAIEAYGALSVNSDTHLGTAMICFDVDRFKPINDTLGHAFGDQVLVEITSRISSVLRTTDVFSRLGGDEFLIILPNVTAAETTQIAERCRAVVAEGPITALTETTHATISVGVEWKRQLVDFATFLSHADDAMYRAKGQGKNRIDVVLDGAKLTPNTLQHSA